MSILVRRPGDKWRTATGQPYTNETQLQKMLHESPELVPQQGDAQVRAFIRESGLPGSGYTDLIGIDEDGNVYVLECKLITNSEIRRKVVGQILEYAAFLWGMSYDNFDRLFVQREGKTIADLISAKVSGDWSFDIFREAVKQNLETGTFRLLIVVDEMNEGLARIIRYITSRGGGVRLEALELKLYREGETEILVPNLHGEQVQPGDKTLQRKQTIEQVIESCEILHVPGCGYWLPNGSSLVRKSSPAPVVFPSVSPLDLRRITCFGL